MTVSATSTTRKTRRGNSLHGILKFLSSEYCSKSNKRRNRNKILSRSLPVIRKSFTRRGVVSTHNHTHDGRNEYDATGEKLSNISVQNSKVKGPASQGPDSREGKSASAVSKDSANVAESESAKQQFSERKEDERRKTMTTRKLFYPEHSVQYEEAENVQYEAMNRIEAARRKVNNDQVEQVWGLYMYGLKHVLALNDLSDAPDAILPGNF